MEISIITPHRKLVQSEPVDELFAPGQEGTLNIFPDHADFVTELETGVLKWKHGGSWRSATVSFGWLQIVNQKITVLADVSELASEIDVTRAKQAESKARQRIEEGGLEADDLQKWELKLKRSMARQNAGE